MQALGREHGGSEVSQLDEGKRCFAGVPIARACGKAHVAYPTSSEVPAAEAEEEAEGATEGETPESEESEKTEDKKDENTESKEETKEKEKEKK